MKKILIIIVSLLILLLPLKTNAAARTYGDLLDELDRLERQKQKQDTEKQISEAEYNKVVGEMQAIEAKVADLNNQIITASNKIEELEKTIQEKKEETDNILVFLQLSNGEKSYLEYIFKATSFTDFIHRISIVEQLSKYNKEQINEMKSLIKQNNELKDKLAKDIESEQKNRDTLQEKMFELGSRIDELEEDSVSIEDLIKSQKQLIEFYRQKGCSNSYDLLSTCMAIPTSTGFKRPTETGIITSTYGYRTNPLYQSSISFHNGVDIGNKSPAEGTPIYPVASGTVALQTQWGCGGKVMFIYHNINGVKYTSVMMHLLDYNGLEEGDVVSEGEVVAHMGGYSTARKNGGYDSCTTGAHLHLTISRGHVTIANYKASVIDPGSVIYFPGGWWSSRVW